MPPYAESIRQHFDVFHSVILYVALLAALLGYIIGSLRGGYQAARAGAVTAGITALTLCILICPICRYLPFLNEPNSPGAAILFLALASAAGLLGGLAGKSISEYLITKPTRFPSHPAGFPREFLRRDMIEKPDVRKATEKLQRERYTVIDLDDESLPGQQQSTGIDTAPYITGEENNQDDQKKKDM